MSATFILASGSRTRAQVLRQAGLLFDIDSPRLDETAIKQALLAEDAQPRDIADALAEAKARRVANRHPDMRVLGCDQVLAVDHEVLSKPSTVAEAEDQLLRLRGRTHHLLSAAVLYQGGEPVWRHVAVVRLTMRAFSDDYLAGYLQRNWPGVSDAVGGYKIEEEGVRLFSRIEGSHFAILGLPLIAFLDHLALTGAIDA
jgi:septum formation protein